jgi:cell division protease FtsH
MDNNNKPSPFKNPFIMFLILSVAATVILNLLVSYITTPKQIEVPYSQFIQMIKDDKVKEVVISSDKLVFETKSDAAEATPTPDILSALTQTPVYKRSVYYYTGALNDLERLLPLMDEHGVEYYRDVPYSNPILKFIVTWILPFAIMYVLLTLIMRSFSKNMGGGGFMSMGRSNAKIYQGSKTDVNFTQVAGQEEAKESLNEIVDFLHNPEKYRDIGAKQPKGALLVGPPGTGKTMLAKAVAGEANVPFFSISGSEFVEMFVGMGASRVRDLFKQASEKAPCIIFIDEIDAIGKSRDSQYGGGGNDEREQTLNQLLSEMDGFDSSKAVVILAATNRPEILDKALLRPGRFDRRIIVERPDLKGREDILGVHIKNVKVDGNINLHEIALATSGAVGADLANMVNEAALRAVRMGRAAVEQEDLMEAVELVIAGKEKKDKILSEKERRIVSYHEVGHALAAALQKNSQPVQKITIVPRTMGSLGYTLTMPEEEHNLMSKSEMLDEITVFLAGRAAEELVFDTQTTGAANDIEKATQYARNMITQYGMSDKFGMTGLESVQNRYLDGRAVSNCSEETQTAIDNEIISLLKERYRIALELLSENREALDEIAEFLIQKETITGDEFMKILNRVRGIEDDSGDEPDEQSDVQPDEQTADASDEQTADSSDSDESTEIQSEPVTDSDNTEE